MALKLRFHGSVVVGTGSNMTNLLEENQTLCCSSERQAEARALFCSSARAQSVAEKHHAVRGVRSLGGATPGVPALQSQKGPGFQPLLRTAAEGGLARWVFPQHLTPRLRRRCSVPFRLTRHGQPVCICSADLPRLTHRPSAPPTGCEAGEAAGGKSQVSFWSYTPTQNLVVQQK